MVPLLSEGGELREELLSCSQWKREKKLAQKRNLISSSHSLGTFKLGEVEVSVNIQTGQALM